jgi:outer membrane protein OmpA-like peptidoglycan-associated protein
MKHGAAFLVLAVGLSGPACAQVEGASGAQVVYDPMTNTTRVTDPLFRPNMPAPVALSSAPIRLHMPKRHVVHHAPAVAAAPPADAPAVAEAAPETPVEAAPAPEPAAPPPPAPKVVKKAPKVAETAPITPVSPPQDMAAPSGPDAAIPFSMDSSTAAYAPPPKSAKHGKTERVASAEPQASGQDGKHIRIIFTAGATEPTPETAASVASVASNLNSSLRTGSDRVLLQSYGGAAGDKSSNSRRLCLKRALSVRQLLIDAGIPSDRIDVRAMGGAGVGDPPDRVDLIVHG